MLLLRKYKIKGHSMSPFLKDNDEVFVSSLPYIFKTPKINDVIALFSDGVILIKRIKEIKDENYYVLGDNENDSLDSRNFGTVKKNEILGKVILKI